MLLLLTRNGIVQRAPWLFAVGVVEKAQAVLLDQEVHETEISHVAA